MLSIATPMQVKENVSLKTYNTFGIDALARHFAAFRNVEELQSLIAENGMPALVLGGGSNLLLTKNIDGLVIKNDIKGIEPIQEDDNFYYIKAGAGENWHQFVMDCIHKNRAGVENLSLIPGNVGASPMQNIGAYGVEIKEVFHSLDAFHLQDKTVVTFSAADCSFGYRESIFKRKYKNQFVILNVSFRLDKKPVYHTSYGAITEELDKMGVKDLSIQSISQAIINIRSSKLPDPAVIGNAGSFFKNPEVPEALHQSLLGRFPGIVGYRLQNRNVKLSAGWLIEQCGWKGFRKGDAGCHAKQALVLVNYGNATGKEVYDLSEEIVQSVAKRFGVTLEREVNII